MGTQLERSSHLPQIANGERVTKPSASDLPRICKPQRTVTSNFRRNLLGILLGRGDRAPLFLISYFLLSFLTRLLLLGAYVGTLEHNFVVTPGGVTFTLHFYCYAY